MCYLLIKNKLEGILLPHNSAANHNKSNMPKNVFPSSCGEGEKSIKSIFHRKHRGNASFCALLAVVYSWPSALCSHLRSQSSEKTDAKSNKTLAKGTACLIASRA